MITEEQILDNQNFFEKCAKDYRSLATELMGKLAGHLHVKVDEKEPLTSFAFLKKKKQNRKKNKFDDWQYFVHGYHCSFEHMDSGQKIEVDLTTPGEFGALDPLFFSKFINTTPAYKPLPVILEDEYHDGVRVIEKMLAIGKFEMIHQVSGQKVAIVSEREDFNFNWGNDLKQKDKKVYSIFKSRVSYYVLISFLHLINLFFFYFMLNLVGVSEINDSLLLQLLCLTSSYFVSNWAANKVGLNSYEDYIKIIEEE